MRVLNADDAQTENRDALAQDWHRLLAVAFPDALWISIPNVGGQVTDYVRNWKLDGFILTGGNDLGASPIRDATEMALVQYALENDVPVFGVSRGLHIIQHFFGGPVRDCPREAHQGTFHSIAFNEMFSPSTTRIVNSFHTQGVAVADLASPLLPLATSEDGWVEALMHKSAAIQAIQWHPERNRTAELDDILWMRRALKFSESIEAENPSGETSSRWLTPFTFPPLAH